MSDQSQLRRWAIEQAVKIARSFNEVVPLAQEFLEFVEPPERAERVHWSDELLAELHAIPAKGHPGVLVEAVYQRTGQRTSPQSIRVQLHKWRKRQGRSARHENPSAPGAGCA